MNKQEVGGALIGLGVVIIFCWSVVGLVNYGATKMQETSKKEQAKREECVILKYKGDAKGFLDNDCGRWVLWR